LAPRSSAAAKLALVCAALVAASGVAVWAAPPTAEGPPTRESVWRAIFARPPEARAGAAGQGSPVEQSRIALGRDLFQDVRLSGAGQASCAFCHDPAHAFTDGRKTAVGPGGAVLPRNAPALYDLAWGKSFFWDGRAASLADQARFPILSPDELAGDFTTIAARLSADPAVKARFEAAFPGSEDVTEREILDALVAYERSLVSPETRFDRWVEGDDAALDERELAGFDIFVGKAACVSCHGGWRLTDDSFHDVGLESADLGRGALSPGGSGLPEFKTPSLREVAGTAPYMHDGSLATLADVVNHYAGHLVKRPSLAPTLVRDLELTADEKESLIAFLRTLSSEPGSHAEDEATRPMIKK